MAAPRAVEADVNPERWQAIGDVFERAALLPEGEQTAFVDRTCASDAELHKEVVSLLASHRAASGGFVQHRIQNALSLFFDATNVAEQPVRVGQYRLIRELGRGGMGTVFLAERDDDQYHAQVAIKLVRPGMDTEFILARFRRERQTLARLQHPNISRLLDGGTTSNGLPYIVMEYIEGAWLTDYANTRGLGIDGRLRLFIDVCSAVDYAHRHFIIHRDLKPGNILVDGDGVAKLLDFGICKLLRSDPVAGHETVVAPLTPNYASPEQVHGDAVTPLSDVYSLGAVLYELLTGRSPRQFENLTPRAIDAAFDRPIAKPSAIAPTKSAGRKLSGDLDNILMRALEPEPERRYESAAQFAEDLRRYLDREPVRARPQTLRYRALKFAQRHRVQVAAAAVVFLALSIGLAVSISERRIADARLEQVRRMADKLVFDVHDSVGDLPGSIQARKLIVQTALDFLDSSANVVSGDPRAETELARAYRRLGDVQGGVQLSNLGDTPAAQARYARAIALVDAALKRTPNALDAVAERLILYDRIGELHAFTGKLQDAVATLAEGIRFGKPFAGAPSAPVRSALAAVYLQSSDAKRNLNDFAGGLTDATECLRLFESAVALDPQPATRKELATAYAAVGMSESQLGKLAEALEHFRHGADEMEKLVASSPLNVTWNRDLMMAYGHIGDALGNPGLENSGDRAGALDAYRRAAAIAKKLYDVDRADQRAASDYGIVLSRVETTMGEDDVRDKIAVQRESLQVLGEAARIDPTNVALKIYVSLVNQHLGDAYTATGDVAAAQKAYQESVATAEAGMASGHVSLVTIAIQSNQRLALNAIARGRRADALTHARRSLEIGETAKSSAPVRSLPRAYSAMALTYDALRRSPLRQADDRTQAESWLQKALDAWRSTQSQPGFAAPHIREMRDIEQALARLHSEVRR